MANICSARRSGARALPLSYETLSKLSGAWWSRAAAYDEVRREVHAQGVGRLAFGHSQHEAGRFLAHALEGLMDRRELRAHPAREGDVVVADHRQVVGDGEPDLPRCGDGAERLQVAAGEDGRRTIGERQD